MQGFVMDGSMKATKAEIASTRFLKEIEGIRSIQQTGLHAI